MSIKWIDIDKPPKDEAERHARMYMGGCTPPWPNEERGEYASTLASSLIGLNLQQAEDKLRNLEGGYNLSGFTVEGIKRRFRIEKIGIPGWSGITFFLEEGSVIQEARVD